MYYATDIDKSKHCLTNVQRAHDIVIAPLIEKYKVIEISVKIVVLRITNGRALAQEENSTSVMK